MNKRIKKKWLKALRSGEYEKGELMLHNIEENTYCCLGVLKAIHPGLVEDADSDQLSALSCAAVGLTTRQQAVLASLNDNETNNDLATGRPVKIRKVQRNPTDFRRVIRYIEKYL